ncbi:Rhodanese domain containing protein [Asbolus verrucosus]|uniref:Rhodanese domain containing protein n=1 Tax=Asbolus verrucosus TaxID=1661398 RepID=A0A482VVF1_ASBVE|nr:Rhodanese domain containing protein [Asbolus verrucosus]
MAKDNHNVLLIDVREAQELQETGMIPGSINISLKKIEDVLKNMSVKDFQEQYGRNKPNANFPIIFSCKAGIRSKQAQDIAIKLGYTDTKNYEGGWLDWVEKNK